MQGLSALKQHLVAAQLRQIYDLNFSSCIIMHVCYKLTCARACHQSRACQCPCRVCLH